MMTEIEWHRRETRRTTEKTNVGLRFWRGEIPEGLTGSLAHGMGQENRRELERSQRFLGGLARYADSEPRKGKPGNGSRPKPSWRFVNPRAAAGVDRLTARAYGENLTELVGVVKAESYRSKCILRRYIPKPNGKLRPLGIPAIADKVLQVAVAKILEAVYEADFLPCHYGHRPRRGALDAVRDLSRALQDGDYHVVVEADIQGFFDHISHDKLMEMLEERIDDRPFLGLVRRWLKAGILEWIPAVHAGMTGFNHLCITASAERRNIQQNDSPLFFPATSTPTNQEPTHAKR